MSHIDIIDQYTEFTELFNFLLYYFSDDWEGRSEADIVMEALQENPREYIEQIRQQLSQFIESDLPLDSKHAIIEAANLYFESDEEVIEWLRQINQLLKTHR